MSTKTWYANNNENGQGLVIDEKTGRTVAVAYDSKDTLLIASAPELLEALEEMLDAFDIGQRATPSSAIGKARRAYFKVMNP